MNSYVLSLILIMAAVTFFIRLSPFLFSQFLKDKPFVHFLGHRLPLMIMPILIVASLPKDTLKKGLTLRRNCWGIRHTDSTNFFKKPLLSIFGGTFIYIIGLQIL